MRLVDDQDIRLGHFHRRAADCARVQRLDRRHLHRLAQSRRKAGLNNSSIHPGRVELGVGLGDDLAAMRDHQDPATRFCGTGYDGRRDYSLARARGRD